MQQRAGLLFLAKTTGRILLILENQRWTVPTFARSASLLEDSESALKDHATGRILPIELYLSEDRGFEYGTYVCVVEQEFLNSTARTICWSDLDDLPKQLHLGLKTTLNNQVIRIKIETILELENVKPIAKNPKISTGP
jgi:hypothetical protein